MSVRVTRRGASGRWYGGLCVRGFRGQGVGNVRGGR